MGSGYSDSPTPKKLYDVWRLIADRSGNSVITANLERVDDTGAGLVGVGVTESGGEFSFPYVGQFNVGVIMAVAVSNDTADVQTEITLDGGLNWQYFAVAQVGNDATNRTLNGVSDYLLKVHDVDQVRVRFKTNSFSGSVLKGNTNINRTIFTFEYAGEL